MTALEHCCQIINQKWPQVFLKGPCGHKHQHSHVACTCVHHSHMFITVTCSHRANPVLPERGCRLAGLPRPWQDWHWCSHFQSFQVSPDCDRLQTTSQSSYRKIDIWRKPVSLSFSEIVTLTWADVSVAVQIPIDWKFCHFIGMFTGFVTNLLVQDKTTASRSRFMGQR